MRRQTWSTLLVVTCCTVASACSGDEGKSADQVPIRTTALATTPTDPPPTSAPPVESPQLELPPLEPAVGQLVSAQLDDSSIAEWLDQALTAVSDDTEPCTATIDTMSSAVAEATFGLADEVIGELMLNLDGALGGLALACDTGDATAIDQESTDAQAISIAIQQRLSEIER